MFVANLVILAQIYDELWRRQAKFPRILSQNGQNDIEGQGQWPPFSIPVQSIPWCMFGANLVIPAQIYNELSCGQGKVYGQTDKTDRRTDGQMDRRMQGQYPFNLKGQGVKATQINNSDKNQFLTYLHYLIYNNSTFPASNLNGSAQLSLVMADY